MEALALELGPESYLVELPRELSPHGDGDDEQNHRINQTIFCLAIRDNGDDAGYAGTVLGSFFSQNLLTVFAPGEAVYSPTYSDL